MTIFERSKQPLSVFEHAGRTAFAMQIPKGNNPYVKTDKNGVAEPSNLAWDRGYQAAADEAFQREHPAKPRVERKPFKRSSTGPKFTPKPQPPANHPRFVKVTRGK
jgi:hypothetical protein